ncbi:MAG: hypothetical protein M0033_03970 [Nitrospiraceae bacterium]|nr:hypothetical protein [Nitrospiraceae bacterium]
MKVKPSKPVSAGSVIGLAFMIAFGIAFTVLVGATLSKNDAPLALKFMIYIFMAVWLGVAIFMLIYHGLNLKRTKGLPFLDIDSESEVKTEVPMQRLRELDALKKDGLISEEEYKGKRNEIMGEKW